MPSQTESVGQSSILNLIEEHAVRSGTPSFVQSGQRRLSYSELNTEAERLASQLRTAGIGGEVLVAICLPRSLDSVIATVGVLKAGAAFLPIDPQMPAPRLEYMLADAGATAVITSAELAGNFPNRRLFVIDQIADAASLWRAPDSAPDNLAYVIFTSGSTGKPKGVEVTHRTFQMTIRNVAQQLQITRADTVLAVTSQSFDVSLLEMFVALTSGANLVLLPHAQVMQADLLIAAIEEYDVTILFGTPMLWRLVLESGWKGKRSLCAITGGETLDAALAGKLLQRTRALWNHYGPTEATIVTTTHRVQPKENPVPIGMPLPGVQTFIVNEANQLAGEGQTGELLIGGETLARGYRNHPELTAASFVPFALPGGFTERVYRTGDLVRARADGSFEYAGRIDNQVKVRGFRIELEEVEAILAEHENLALCAVVVHDDPQWGKSLVAYYQWRGPQPESAETLRSFLAGALPAYMLPSHYVGLTEFPRTINGKVDRQELSRRPLPSSPPDTKVEGLDPIAAELLAIWRRLLRLPSAGVHDNFFELGGHSILAARLFTEIRERLHKSLPLATLLEAPTVDKLSRIIANAEAPRWTPLVPIRTQGEGSPFFCIHPIGGNVLIFRELSEAIEGRPFYGLQARGLNGEEQPHTGIEAMAADYLGFVREVQPQGPYLLGGYSAGGLVAFEMARLLRSMGEEVQVLALFDTYLHALSLPGLAVPAVAEGRPTPAVMKALTSVQRRWTQARRANGGSWLTVLGRDVARIWATLKLKTYSRCRQWGFSPFYLDAVSGFLLALRTYKPKPLNVNALLFLADDNAPPAARSLPIVWRELVSGELDVVHLPTDHDRLLSSPSATVLAARIESKLAPNQAV